MVSEFSCHHNRAEMSTALGKTKDLSTAQKEKQENDERCTQIMTNLKESMGHTETKEIVERASIIFSQLKDDFPNLFETNQFIGTMYLQEKIVDLQDRDVFAQVHSLVQRTAVYVYPSNYQWDYKSQGVVRRCIVSILGYMKKAREAEKTAREAENTPQVQSVLTGAAMKDAQDRLEDEEKLSNALLTFSRLYSSMTKIVIQVDETLTINHHVSVDDIADIRFLLNFVAGGNTLPIALFAGAFADLVPEMTVKYNMTFLTQMLDVCRERSKSASNVNAGDQLLRDFYEELMAFMRTRTHSVRSKSEMCFSGESHTWVPCVDDEALMDYITKPETKIRAWAKSMEEGDFITSELKKIKIEDPMKRIFDDFDEHMKTPLMLEKDVVAWRAKRENVLGSVVKETVMREYKKFYAPRPRRMAGTKRRHTEDNPEDNYDDNSEDNSEDELRGRTSAPVRPGTVCGKGHTRFEDDEDDEA